MKEKYGIPLGTYKVIIMHDNRKELIKDLERLEHMVSSDTNLLIHVGRVADLARGGYYHMKSAKPSHVLDQALNEGDGVYRP